MARTPIHDRPLIAQWLIGARATRDGTASATGKEDVAGRRSYTVDDLRRDMLAAGVNPPNRSTLAGWESGATTPSPSSVRMMTDYWAAHRVPGPEAPAASPPAPDLATALLALARELSALREERKDLVERVADLETTVAKLAVGTPHGAAPGEQPNLGALGQ